jgi:hypothetical protein
MQKQLLLHAYTGTPKPITSIQNNYLLKWYRSCALKAHLKNTQIPIRQLLNHVRIGIGTKVNQVK